MSKAHRRAEDGEYYGPPVDVLMELVANTCETCKLWGQNHPTASDRYYKDNEEMIKTCGSPKMIYLAQGEMQIDGLGYDDGEGYRALLRVGMDFGCIHHTPK